MRMSAAAIAIALVPAGTLTGEPSITMATGRGGYSSWPCGFVLDGAEITDGPNGYRINGQDLPDPITAKPCLEYWVVREAKAPPNGSGSVRLEMRQGGINGASMLRLYFSTGAPSQTLARLFVTELERDRLMKEFLRHTKETLRSSFFDTAPLSALSETSKAALMAMAFDEEEGTVRLRVGTQEFKGLQYFVADMGADDLLFYNAEGLSQPQRLAALLSTKLLAKLRELEVLCRGVDALQGVKLDLQIPQERVSDTDVLTIRRLEIYAPLTVLRPFADADITARKMLDGSVILVNGNRVEVPTEL